MSDKRIKLTRRRVLGGIATVGAASAALGAGTFALFSDTESSDNNQLTAGQLDLETGNSQSITFSATDIVPTDSGTTYVDLQKSSSSTIPGDLSITVPSVVSNEGTAAADTAPDGDGSSGQGELDDELELKLWIGTGGADDNTGTFDGSTDIGLNSDGTVDMNSDGGYETAANYDSASWPDVITNFSGPVAFNVEWQFPDQGSNNDAQGDDITVDFDFTLEQQ